MTECIILDAGGVICYPRPGDWLTPVRFEEIIGENRLNSITPEQLSAALGNIPTRACPNDGTELIKALLGIQ